MEQLNILVLHCLGNPKIAPRFLVKHVFALKDSFPEHNYLYHDAGLQLPDNVKESDFDAIILDVTFLCARWAGDDYFKKRLDDYAFVADAKAVKLAFPQDEYDCNELLDQWMCDWNVDIVYSVIPNNWDVLYPKYSKVGRIELAYTGYIDETLLSYPRPSFTDRKIDIGYRARKLPPYFGRIGRVKSEIGMLVDTKAKEKGLATDIKVGAGSEIVGSEWLDFIANSKFTLGANSGSSMLDPRGDIQKSVREYLQANKNASFDKVEENCFPGLDGRYEFTAISPRVLEAAMLDSCQILVNGSYSGILEPWHDFIPINEDASNFDIVYETMKDAEKSKKIAQNCKEKILGIPELTCRGFGQTILTTIINLKRKRTDVSSCESISNLINEYQRVTRRIYLRLYLKQSFVKFVKSKFEKMPFASRILGAAKKIVQYAF